MAIETKHTRGDRLKVDQRVCELLGDVGWDGPGAPVRLITFSLPAARLLAAQVPVLPRSLLVHRDLEPYADGALPEGISVVGVDIDLLRRHPGFVAKARRRGNEVHAWTVNSPADLRFCRDVGVTGVTTDCPNRALQAWRAPEPPKDTLALRRRRRRRSSLAA